jgi:hypothetical protein
MRPGVPLVVLLLVATAVAGCSGSAQDAPRRDAPPGWDDEPVPERSRLADVPFYRLGASSTFLAKDTSYARYIVQVPPAVKHASVFFTTTNGLSDAPAPSVGDDVFHYEFMQIRPLGERIDVVDVHAKTQFRQGTTGHTFTLTYVYGNGADYQYLAPFEGDPGAWALEAGFYELVIATDEKLTVGININLGTDYWNTYYHPQELGKSRAEALQFEGDVLDDSVSSGHRYDESVAGTLSVRDGELLNLFAFADLIYDARAVSNEATLTVEAWGEAWVAFGDRRVDERILVSAVYQERQEAFAYAAHFNQPGPLTAEWAEAGVRFDERAAVGAVRVVQMLVFGVVVEPLETVEDIPLPAPA